VPDPRDWLLTQTERGNPATRLDDQHAGEQAWSEGNLVRPLIHGATYFAELYERIEATRAGDLVFFTDWQGDADERLTGEPGSEVVDVLGRADERGVDVRGLVWRSHSSAIGSRPPTAPRPSPRQRGAGDPRHAGAHGGSRHQKSRGDPAPRRPTHDIAFVGGVDYLPLAPRRLRPRGDPQAQDNLAGTARHRRHDIQAAILDRPSRRRDRVPRALGGPDHPVPTR
jgi:hypothetical protein